MVQVIYAYHGFYPFGRKKESQNTFLQQSKRNLNQIEISVFRQKAKIYQEMNSLFLINLIKILKEDNSLYFIYEYQETSVENYLENIKKTVDSQMTQQTYKSLINDFNTNINQAIKCLIHSEIKALLLLQNIACIAKKEKSHKFSLKVFFDTSAEYLSIIQHSYESRDPKRQDQKGRNQQYLFQFYKAQRKRLAMQFEQLCEKIFGKIIQATQRKTPNFIINGTKLIFINKDQKQAEQNETKNSQNTRDDLKPNSALKQTKDNNPKKVQYLHSSQNNRNNEAEHSPNVNKSEKKKIEGPIIDFDQSFQPEFKPQQFTKEKTFICEQTDYLDSLEQQLKRIAVEKKQHQTKKAQFFQDHNMLKSHQNKKQSMQQVYQARMNKQKNQGEQSQQQINKEQKSKNYDSISWMMFHSKNSNASNQNNSNNESSDKKNQKVKKYKIKIITSHQIQIEGGEQPNVQEIEKQIINNIKNGKISLKDRPKDQKNNSKNQSEESNSKNNSLNGCINRKQQQTKKNKLTQQNERLLVQDKEKTQREDNKEIINLEQPPQNKAKTINQIIQKIGINTQTYSENIHKHQIYQDHIDSIPQDKTCLQARAMKHEDLESNKMYTLQNYQNHEKNNELENELKAEKVQNYINQIKQAKSKAQQLLRQYIKKKQ